VTEPRLTHVDSTGAARMVDVSGKGVTARAATASGIVRTTPEVVHLLRADALPKGDALAVARVAGIMGAKRTPDLVPLCHPIALHSVAVELELREAAVQITVVARTADRTGVEMEALTAVTVTGLTLIDMIKAVDPAATIDQVKVLRKDGGKSGTWFHPEHPAPPAPPATPPGRPGELGPPAGYGAGGYGAPAGYGGAGGVPHRPPRYPEGYPGGQ
jgi:cyclic pyranopterin phosphate synthase